MADQTQQNSSGATATSGQNQGGNTSGADSRQTSGTSDADRAAAAAAQAAQSSSAPQRPDGLPDDLWDGEKNSLRTDVLTQRLKEADDIRAEREARKAAIPPDPTGYKPELPEDVRKALPENTEIDTNDPLWGRLRDLAHKRGWTQDEFSAAAGEWVQAQAADRQRVEADTKAAVERHQKKIHEALGDRGAERVEAVRTFLKGFNRAPSGNDPGTSVGDQLTHAIFTPEIAKWFEGVQKFMTSQGVKDFTQAGRTNDPTNGKPNGFDKWSPIDRRAYELQQNAEAQRH